MTWLLRVGMIAALLLNSAAGHARSYDDVVASGHIRFAVYRNFPPYSYLEDGQPAGLDVELGLRIAKAMGLEPRWLWVTADENVDDDLRNAVWKGDVIHRQVADVMLRVPYDRDYAYATDGYGLPRNDMVVMMAPYHTETWRVARNLDKTRDVRNLAIFQYQPIGVELDSLPDFYLAGAFQGRLRKNLHHYNSTAEALSDFEAGKLSAVVGMGTQLEWGLRDCKLNIDIDDDGLEALGKLSWDIGIAVKHDYRQLAYAVEAIIHQMLNSGDIARLYQSYGVSYQKPAYYQDTLSR